MNKNQGLTVPGKNPNLESGINRHEMVRRLMPVGGMEFALPGMADGHPATKRVVSNGKTAGPDAGIAESGWSPKLLDRHQLETLTVQGERNIPGSLKAQVSQFIDLLPSDATQDAQKKFLASLSAFEAESLRRLSHPYKDLAEIQQNDILTSAAAAEHGEAKERAPQCASTSKTSGPGAPTLITLGNRHDGTGWAGELFFTSFPGGQESGNIYS